MADESTNQDGDEEYGPTVDLDTEDIRLPSGERLTDAKVHEVVRRFDLSRGTPVHIHAADDGDEILWLSLEDPTHVGVAIEHGSSVFLDTDGVDALIETLMHYRVEGRP